MGFSTKQLQELRRDLDRRYVRTREVEGRELSFIGGWYTISEANRIFGFDRWNRETIESRCVLARKNRGTFLAVYVARVRITVNVGSSTVVREGHGTTDVPIVPRAEDLTPGRIDKSVLTISEPKRRRDKAHLRYVATQPCLVCGRQPSDPHHLRFAQPRALGLIVSDEFTVPLCRGHDHQLHQAGNEVAWWNDLDIDALEIAKGIWDETHERKVPSEGLAPTDSNAPFAPVKS